MELYTQNGLRPDLNGDSLKYAYPEKYIGNKILPVVYTRQDSGKIFYRDPDAPLTAQTNRTTATAPNDTLLTNASTTFLCSEVIARASIAEEQVKRNGGIEASDLQGAQAAVRAVAGYVEGQVADVTLKTSAAADYAFNASTILEDVQDAIDKTEDYYGDITLVASRMAIIKLWKAIMADNTTWPYFSRIVSGRRNLAFDEWKEAVAALLGIDKVLVGHNTIWNKGERGDRFAIGRLTDENDPLLPQFECVFGCQMVFLPDPANPAWPFAVRSIPDENNHSNHYDAQIWPDNKVLNAGAVKVFEFGEHSDSASASASA